MKKLLLTLLAVVLICPCALAKSAKIGVLAPIGHDEKDLISWSENITQAEGRGRMFKNPNTVIIYDTLNAMIMALKAGQIDQLSIGLHTAEYLTARDKDFALTDNKHNIVFGYALAVREEDKAKITAVNSAIQKMRSDGTLASLVRENITELGNADPKATPLPKYDDAETIRIAVTGDLPPMDCILADGTPAGFNTAFLAELSRRIHRNFELVSITAGARQTAISSGRVDALFWARSVYTSKREILPYLLDKLSGVAISEPYLIESRAELSLRSN